VTWRWREDDAAASTADAALTEAALSSDNLARLDALGGWVEDRRRAWDAEVFAPHPTRDAEAATLWAGWLSGAPWGIKEGWEARWLPDARKVFAGVAIARGLPDGARRNVIDDLAETFFYRLLGAGDGLPGWAEVAVRTLETQAPVAPIVAALDDRARHTAGTCVAARGHWRRTVARHLPRRLRTDRARAAADLLADPLAAEVHIDLHVTLRLLEAWAQGSPPDRDRAIVLQNRGRARGRLRALAAAGGAAALAEPLLALDALDARTRAALRRYAWAWATQELSWGFTLSPERPVTPPCPLLAADQLPDAEAVWPETRTWILLVVLRGRLAHLRAWVATGSTGDRDTTWGRLLKDLPETLIGDGRGPARYAGTRALLADTLDDALDELAPVLGQIAAAKPGRTLRAAVDALLGPVWSDAVSRPASGFPTMQRHAVAFAAALESGTGPLAPSEGDDAD